MRGLGLVALLPLLQSGGRPPAPGAAPASAPLLARASALLAEGKSVEALAEAELALEHAPDDAAFLGFASKAAEAAGRKDRALFYARLASDALAESNAPKPALDEANRRIAALDPLGSRGRELLRGFAGSIGRLADECASRGLFANAVDLHTRCRGTALEAKALAALEKIYANRKAVDAILDSGLDVPTRAKRRGSAERAAREDAAHAAWDRAWEVKGANYTIVTNMSREIADSCSAAMERMNRFYRTVFRHKERGGNTARCVVKIYRSRAEFDRYEPGIGANVGGFYSLGENRVALYDPRTDRRPIGDLWETLFHEASHQFTHMISADTIPGWLNEGTASYFEGTRLLPNGAVETNLVHAGRLGEARRALEEGKPTLQDLVSFHEQGSYPGEYYGLGWALVFFLHNFEDPRSERVYRPLYGDFMDAYRTGGKHDALERFVSIFVKKAKEPGVDTFEAFDARFRAWIVDLAAIEFGPPEKADDLLARAKKQRADGKREAAAETLRWALRKRPGDAAALVDLAEIELEQKQKDAALLHFRRAFDALRASDGAASRPAEGGGASDCLARIRALDPALAEGLGEAHASMTAGSSEAASAYFDAGFPLEAIRLLDEADRVLGGERLLRERRREIVQASAVETRRWRRLAIADGLAAWEGADAWTVSGEAIVGEADSPRLLYYKEEFDPPYRLEATIRTLRAGEDAGFGVAFGANAEATRVAIVGPGTGGAFVRFDAKEAKNLKAFPAPAPSTERELRIGIEVKATEVEVFLGDRFVSRLPCKPEERQGLAGLMVQDCRAEFRNVRVLR